MKIRQSFVTNSSSSSYVCEACGEAVGGWDLCLSEAEMVECVNGHILCETHIKGSKETYVRAALKALDDSEGHYNARIEQYRIDPDQTWGIRDDSDLERVQNTIIEISEIRAKLIKDEDVDEEYAMEVYQEHDEEWRYSLSEELCPICCNDIILDYTALAFAMNKLGLTRSELDDLYRESVK